MEQRPNFFYCARTATQRLFVRSGLLPGNKLMNAQYVRKIKDEND